MKKTILFLAASLYQLEAIQKAKSLGYRVITTDNNPKNQGHRFADKSYTIDTTDKEGVLAIAREENIDGLIAVATDVAIPTMAYVAEQLNLSGPSLEGVNIACNKALFREFLQKNHFVHPQFIELEEESLDSIDLQGKKWLLKPYRSSGSKGIFIVDNIRDLKRFYPKTLSFSLAPKGVLLEEFIEGFQGTVEGILKEGKIIWSFFLDRQTAPSPYVATKGHRVPTRLSPDIRRKLLSLLEKIWKLLNIREGVFDCDFVVQDDKIYILELSPRIGGNSITKVIEQATSFDLITYAIQQVLGEPLPSLPTQKIQPTALVILGVQSEGRFLYNVEKAEQLRQEPWVQYLTFDKELGDDVFPFINGRHRVGEALISANSREQLDEYVRILRQQLHCRTFFADGCC